MVERERLLGEVVRLVQIPSLSRQEREVGEAIMAALRELGIEAEMDEVGAAVGGNCGNVIGRLPGTAEAPALLLCAHMDTVGPGEGIRPRVEEGIIRSSGDTILGVDDKAGCAAMLEAVRVIRERGLPHAPVELLFTVCEEVGLLGAKLLDKGRLKARHGFVLDGASEVGSVVVHGPGHTVIEATIIGKAAHAGRSPEWAINSIQVASRAIAAMRLGRIDDETVANVGVIQGGTATNVIPERTFLRAEARSRDQVKLGAQVEHMVDLLHGTAEAAGAKAEVQAELAYPVFRVPEEAPVIALARQACEATGVAFSARKSDGGTDASMLNAAGLQTVPVGTGCYEPHSTDEYAAVEELVKLAEFVLAALQAAAAPGTEG